jgi:hypothetical protein
MYVVAPSLGVVAVADVSSADLVVAIVAVVVADDDVAAAMSATAVVAIVVDVAVGLETHSEITT